MLSTLPAAAIRAVLKAGAPSTEDVEQRVRSFSLRARLDVNVGTYLDLRSMIASNQLDLAVVLSEPGGEPDGTVLRRTKFAWVAAETFDVSPGASLPMAFAPPPCVDRRVGTTALNSTSLEWHVAFTSPSQEGIRAAVLAGIAIAVPLQSDVKPGMRIIESQYGLPPLPKAEFTLIGREGGMTPAMSEFRQLLLPMSKISTPSMRRSNPTTN